MANIASAKKKARQAVKNRARNASQKSMIRSVIKKVVKAVEAKDKKAAEAAYAEMTPVLDRYSTRNMIHKNKVARQGLWKCSQCRKQFTVTVGTVFEGSKVGISKWLLAIHLMASSKKGISAHQLHRMLGITYRAAWFINHRLRYAMTSNANMFNRLVFANPSTASFSALPNRVVSSDPNSPYSGGYGVINTISTGAQNPRSGTLVARFTF